jgi:DNA-binding CsgD family transcriptional regulator
MDASASTRAAISSKAPVAPPLVERDAELAAIARVLDGSLAGAGRALVIDGEAGAGKTRLLAEAETLAEERGLECLRARGADLERGFAFGVVRQLLERRVSELELTDRAELLSGVAAPVWTLLFNPPSAEIAGRKARFALIHGLYWMLARLADREPIALLIDDFHWVDEPSAQAVAYLAERLDGLSIALLLTIRTGVAGPLGGAGPLSSSDVESISLAPLSETGAGRVITELLGTHDPSFGATAHRITAGNPLLLRELALAVATERIDTDAAGARRIAALAPASVTRWALARLGLLPEPARIVATSLSVLEEGDLPLVATHAGLSFPETATAADRLEVAGLVEGRPLRFVHPLVRASLYGGLSRASRDLAHRRAAEALADRGEAEAVASHLLRCEPRGERWAVEVLRSAAAESAARGAAAEAATLLRRALRELGDADDHAILEELGEAEAAMRDRAAIAHLEAAASARGDPGIRARALAALSHARYAIGDFRGAFQAGGEALDQIPRGHGGRPEAELLMSFLMAGRAIPELIPEVRRRLGESRLHRASDSTPAELVRLQIGALDAFLRGERTRAGRLVNEVDGALGGQVDLANVPTLLSANVGFVLAGMGDYERAASAYGRALEHEIGRGSPLATAELLESRVSARWWRGDVAGCLADVETILSLVGRESDPAKLPMLMCQASMLLELRDLAGAKAALEYPSGRESRLAGTWGWMALPFGRAQVALACRDWRRALREAEAAGERLAAVDALSPEFLPWRSLAARAAAGMGDEERAIDMATQELEMAEAIGSRRAIGLALTTIGRIRQDVDVLADAVDALDESVTLLEAARARVAFGATLRRSRRARDARQPLREGLDLSVRAGSTALVDLAGAELRAAGGRPRRERTTGLESLTPRERQIAELAASGLANPEIAERLFITRKTVEAHLRNIFRKLDVKDRADLSAVLGTPA